MSNPSGAPFGESVSHGAFSVRVAAGRTPVFLIVVMTEDDFVDVVLRDGEFGLADEGIMRTDDNKRTATRPTSGGVARWLLNLVDRGP
jgi:hypothetical protein